MHQDEKWLLQEKYQGIETAGFHADRALLRAGKPLAYIIGNIPFLGTTIYLDSTPLIPRTETEYWIQHAIDEIKKKSSVKMLDLCAGSGCIGIAVLKHVPHAYVDFIEIDELHHATIEKNIRENNLPLSQTRILGGSLFEKLDQTKYDFILTNPPYIDQKNNQTDESVIRHEPHRALWGGLDGLEFIKSIIDESPKHLTDDGVLYIEHEPEQTNALQILGKNSSFHTETYTDQYGNNRYSRFTRTSK